MSKSRIFVLLPLLPLLCGCGQKGPLYLEPEPGEAETSKPLKKKAPAPRRRDTDPDAGELDTLPR